MWVVRRCAAPNRPHGTSFLLIPQAAALLGVGWDSEITGRNDGREPSTVVIR